MTDAHLWALLAFLAFLGWGVSNALTARNILPMANALAALQKISGFVDDRISAQLERARKIWENQGMPTTQMKPPDKPQRNAASESIREIFGGDPLEAPGEQPDAGLEIAE